MARSSLRLVPALVCVFLVSCKSSPTVEIIRDQWGVPHIFAGDENAGFFGLGYVSAEDTHPANGNLAEARVGPPSRDIRV